MTKILLLGKSASGKDTLRKYFLEVGFKEALSHTTRPMRDYEKDGVDYHFITMEKFLQLEKENFFIESEIFREWKYGRSYEAVNIANVLISTVTGIENMIDKLGRDDFFIIEIICDEAVRIERSLKRGDNPEEVERRRIADDLDFSKPRKFINDLTIKSDNFDRESFKELHTMLQNDYMLY